MSTEEEPGWNKRVKRQAANPLHVTKQQQVKIITLIIEKNKLAR